MSSALELLRGVGNLCAGADPATTRADGRAAARRVAEPLERQRRLGRDGVRAAGSAQVRPGARFRGQGRRNSRPETNFCDRGRAIGARERRNASRTRLLPSQPLTSAGQATDATRCRRASLRIGLQALHRPRDRPRVVPAERGAQHRREHAQQRLVGVAPASRSARACRRRRSGQRPLPVAAQVAVDLGLDDVRRARARTIRERVCRW